jgi:penicillin-binding protein 2
MIERPRVLIELGEELDRVARQTLTSQRRRRRLGALSMGSGLAVLAASAAVVVAVAAIVLIGHRHGASGSTASKAAGPRGEILDRDGGVLTGSRRMYGVQIVLAKLPVPVRDPRLGQLAVPPSADQAVYDGVAEELGISQVPQKCAVEGHVLLLAPVDCDVARARLGPDVTVVTDVTPIVARDLAAQKLPSVTEPPVYVTSYPYVGLAAQVLGTVGPITAAEVHEPQFRGVPYTAVVGQTGLERFYDRYLRAGDTLKTSLDLRLEETGQASLARSLAGNAPPHSGGAFVAMDPENGQVYAMGSLPTFNPNIFTRPISDREYQRMFGPQANGSLENRAIAALYTVGSTFKPITATAALESGVWNVDESYDDIGSFDIDGQVLHNSGHAAHGTVNLVDALRVSDDIFFDNLGALLNANPLTHPDGGALQTWARLYGLGHPTGVDLPYEASGLVASPRDLKRWTIADNIVAGIGQGDDLLTPLQLAVTYAAIANGGTIVRPHIGSEIEVAGGNPIVIGPPPARHISIKPAYLSAIQHGLREAASQPGGTSADVMGSFPEPVYGMTGTAQSVAHGRQRDQAWYAAYVPASATSKPIVVVVTVEQGGFGAVAAAPVARQILSQWFYGKPGPYVPGTSTTL